MKTRTSRVRIPRATSSMLAAVIAGRTPGEKAEALMAPLDDQVKRERQGKNATPHSSTREQQRRLTQQAAQAAKQARQRAYWLRELQRLSEQITPLGEVPAGATEPPVAE